MSSIQLRRHTSTDLHNTAQELIVTLQKELKTFGACASNDRLLAMAVNPFTASIDLLECELLRNCCKDSDTIQACAVDHSVGGITVGFYGGGVRPRYWMSQ